MLLRLTIWLRIYFGEVGVIVVVVVITATALSATRTVVLLLLCAGQYGVAKGRLGELTTAWTFSMMACFARSIASLDPTRPISRSKSCPFGCETLILQPVSTCMFLIVSPPWVRCQHKQAKSRRGKSYTFSYDHTNSF